MRQRDHSGQQLNICKASLKALPYTSPGYKQTFPAAQKFATRKICF